jgi:hypothetical protein
MAVLACMSVVTASSSQLAVLPYTPDLGPVAAFLNTDGHDRWRYQTFGFGEPSVALGYLTSATTIDGAYFTARAVPELTDSGIGMIDYALWWDPSGEALRRVLARADDYSVRWAFVAEPGYEPYLAAAGYRPLTTLDGGVAVWDKADVPPLPASARRFGDVDALGVLWGTLPLTLSALVLALGFAQYRPIRVARGGRAVRRWREGRSLAPLSR